MWVSNPPINNMEEEFRNSFNFLCWIDKEILYCPYFSSSDYTEEHSFGCSSWKTPTVRPSSKHPVMQWHTPWEKTHIILNISVYRHPFRCNESLMGADMFLQRSISKVNPKRAVTPPSCWAKYILIFQSYLFCCYKKWSVWNGSSTTSGGLLSLSDIGWGVTFH